MLLKTLYSHLLVIGNILQISIDNVPIAVQEEDMVGLSFTSEAPSYSPELLSSLSSLSSLCSPVNFLTVPDASSQPLTEPNQEEESIPDANVSSQYPSLSQEPLSSSVKSTGPGE